MKPRSLIPGLLLALAVLAPGVRAQVKVTGVTYGTLNNGPDVNDQGNAALDFQSQYTPVLSVATGIGSYRFDGPTASSIVSRRNTTSGAPNNTTVFYQTQAGGGVELGQYESSLQNMFLSANLTEGLRNPFANINTGNGAAAAQNTNIERIDFTLTNYVVRANDSLVFFDLEDAGNFGDGFRIAAFTATGTVNGIAGAPTVYANNGFLVAPDAFGPAVNSPTGGINGDFERATYTAGDDLSLAVTTTNISYLGNGNNGLNLVGIMIRFSDLGIAAGTMIQGFSLMAADVVLTSSSGTGLVNWNDTTAYRTNTDGAGVGNMDFMAFGATVARPVPEPSTYGVIMVGAALSGWMLIRRKRQSAQSAA